MDFAFQYQSTTTDQLPENIRPLVATAYAATDNAYAPYSGFKVGVAILMKDNTVKTGANIENASYPAGICGERAALSGINPKNPGQAISAIVINYKGGAPDQTPVAPCGICRQVILEYQLAQESVIQVYLCSPENKVIVIEDASLLLPLYFSNKNLG